MFDISGKVDIAELLPDIPENFSVLEVPRWLSDYNRYGTGTNHYDSSLKESPSNKGSVSCISHVKSTSSSQEKVSGYADKNIQTKRLHSLVGPQ